LLRGGWQRHLDAEPRPLGAVAGLALCPFELDGLGVARGAVALERQEDLAHEHVVDAEGLRSGGGHGEGAASVMCETRRIPL